MWPWRRFDDAVAELSETVIMTVMANSNYSVALPTSATISILDNETPEISFAAAPPGSCWRATLHRG